MCEVYRILLNLPDIVLCNYNLLCAVYARKVWCTDAGYNECCMCKLSVYDKQVAVWIKHRYSVKIALLAFSWLKRSTECHTYCHQLLL